MFETLGERLRFARKSKGMSQEEFALLVGSNSRMIGAYERDESGIPNRVMAEICVKAGISADYLLLGKDLHTERNQMLQKARDNTTVKNKIVGGCLEITIKTPITPEIESL